MIKYFLILVLLTSAVIGADEVTISPDFPFPNELLVCRYNPHEQGQVLKFSWFQNEQFVKEKTTDKPSDIFNQPTARGDEIRCQVELSIGRLLPLGTDVVYVGERECNDGVDNDGDGTVDLLDPGCDSRSDKQEFHIPDDYCETHPDNLFCLEIGFTDFLQLCDASPGNVLCVQNQVMAIAQNACPDESPLCTGIENVVQLCNPLVEGAVCTGFAFTVQFCDKDELCYELTEDDKQILCSLNAYDFCPEPAGEEEEEEEEEEAKEEAKGGDEAGGEDGPEEEAEPRNQDEPKSCNAENLDLCSNRKLCNRNNLVWYNECYGHCPVGTSDHDGDGVCTKLVQQCGENQILQNGKCITTEKQPICGDAICEEAEIGVCTKDCYVTETKEETDLFWIVPLLVGLGVVFLASWHMRRRRR